jgi:hypothetical protein
MGGLGREGAVTGTARRGQLGCGPWCCVRCAAACPACAPACALSASSANPLQDVAGLLTNVLSLHVTTEKVVRAADFAKGVDVESLFEETELTCSLERWVAGACRAD